MDDAVSTPPEAACRICGSTDLTAVSVREMMFGTRQPFAYLECASCGCIQIAGYPADIARHYPDNYYSFQNEAAAPPALYGSMKSRLKSLILRSPALHRRWIASGGLQRWLGARPEVKVMVDHASGPLTRILDVGCGSGQLLKVLDWLGYRRLNGVDPFIKADIAHRGRILVRKASLADIEGPFDLVSLHHSLEHMPEQHTVMQNLRRLLAPGGKLLIRIPVGGGEAWRQYREDWVQLDAPRHYYVHSRRSIELLAQRSGLRLSRMIDDSTPFQFWGSELYRRDIPLSAAGNASRARQDHFTPQEWQRFEQRAVDANRAGEGDQIAAVFERA